MKKLLAMTLILVMMFSLSACGKSETEANVTSTDFVSNNIEKSSSNKSSTDDSSDFLKEKFQAEIESALNSLTVECETFIAGITNYGQYVSNMDKVEEFYQKIGRTSETLCINLYSYSIEYAETILASNAPVNDMREELDVIYDVVYEDLADDIYDGIYDGLLKDEVYDGFYNGALKKRPEEIEYSDWSDVRSNEYELWSDMRSDVYEHWSDARSDVYSFWSDLRSELYSDDTDDAKDEIEDFREDVEKMKKKVSSSTVAPTTTSVPATTSDAADTTSNKTKAEWKQFLKDYEAWVDDYIAIVKKYKNNPTDMSILSDYTDMVSEMAEWTKRADEIELDLEDTSEALEYSAELLRIAGKLAEAAY